MDVKKIQLEELAKKVRKAAACCSPRYHCNLCPYRLKDDCYSAFISNMVYLIENGYNFIKENKK